MFAAVRLDLESQGWKVGDLDIDLVLLEKVENRKLEEVVDCPVIWDRRRFEALVRREAAVVSIGEIDREAVMIYCLNVAAVVEAGLDHYYSLEIFAVLLVAIAENSGDFVSPGRTKLS